MNEPPNREIFHSISRSLQKADKQKTHTLAMEMRTVSPFKPLLPPLCTLPPRGCSARMRPMSTTMKAPSGIIRRLRMPRSVSCEAAPALEPKAVAKVSPPVTLVVPDPPSTQQYQVPEGGAGTGVIIGARVRVKVPLKVYHVARVAQVVELTGMEGRVKEYVGVSKGGINLSANLPFKVEFVYEEGKRGPGGLLKFTAHLKQDEFDYI